MTTESRVVRTAAALFCALSLAACGGGGGGGSAPVSPGGPAATPTPTPAAITKTQARAAMQSSLTIVQQADGGSASAGALGVMRRVQAISHGRRPLAVAGCSNGSSVVVVVNPGGSTTETDTYYYDAGCTAIEERDVFTIPATATLSNLTATGTITTYARSGSVTAYATIQLALVATSTLDTATISESVYTNVNGTLIGKVGTTCLAPPTNVSFHCGAALFTNTGGAETGASIDESASSVVSGSATTISATATASAYAAASGLDIAQGAAPVWTITGASPIETVTGTVTIVLTGSTPTSGTMTISDVTDGVTIAGTANASGITLTATAHGAAVATVVVDHAGNGTITYADGTTATITAWTING